jgi:glycosyltransferase involved in cell wall biosynthesis
MSHAILILDNLRIGGFQRLALDQAYGLAERGYKTRIFLLDDVPSGSVPSFLSSESALISKFGIEIQTLGKSRSAQLRRLLRISRRAEPKSLVLCHSLRATFLLFFVNLGFGQRLRVISTIHQLPTLSDTRQRFIRFIYSQFSWRLLAYSTAVKADWDTRVQHNYFFKNFIARKKIEVLRNGIYLNRLPEVQSFPNNQSRPRLIYLGRNTSWKGVSTFIEISRLPKLSGFDVMIMVPSQEDIDISSIDSSNLARYSIVAGKTIASYQPRQGDVHLYPATYGVAAKYIESVSLNCLELACLGVPTLLTKNGLGTWPDLLEFKIFHETDWENIGEIADQILNISSLRFTPEILDSLVQKIDIQNQLESLIHLSNFGELQKSISENL